MGLQVQDLTQHRVRPIRVTADVCGRCRDSIILLGVRVLRTMERVVPARVFGLICWLMAASQAAGQTAFAVPTMRRFAALPPSLRPSAGGPAWVGELWREKTRVNLAQLLCLWPDRLGREPWTGRCRHVGLERVERAHAGGQPVILASFHFGPVVVLGHWLRSRGLPAAFLRGESSAGRPCYWRYIDRLTADRHPPGLASGFDPTELRRTYEHLQSGGILNVMLEGFGHRRRIKVSGEGFRFEMATGCLRLAAMTGATVLPCSLVAGPGMSFTLHVGEPVPPDLVADPDRHRSACEHLLRELISVVGRHPGQWHPLLRAHFQPETEGESSAPALSPRKEC